MFYVVVFIYLFLGLIFLRCALKRLGTAPAPPNMAPPLWSLPCASSPGQLSDLLSQLLSPSSKREVFSPLVSRWPDLSMLCTQMCVCSNRYNPKEHLFYSAKCFFSTDARNREQIYICIYMYMFFNVIVL